MPETKTGGKLRLLLTCHFSTVIYKTRAKALEKNFLPFIIIEESYLQTFSHSLDAEIASLTLTIPSWNSSIERVLKVSDFKIASDTAKYKLKYQLMCLISTTNNILKKLEEI